MTDTVPAATTGLPKPSLDDFDADDSGAMAHRIAQDPYDQFIAALAMLLAPLPATSGSSFHRSMKRIIGAG